jgi:hypothetical protein
MMAIKDLLQLKHNGDSAQLLTTALGVILDITGLVYTALEPILSNSMGDDYNADMFTLCTVAVDNGLIDIVSALLAVTMTTTPSKLSLGSDGSVVVEAQSFASTTTALEANYSSPTPAITWFTVITQTAAKIGPPLGKLAKDVASPIYDLATKEKKFPEQL